MAAPTKQAIAGAGTPTNTSAPAPGSYFGYPLFGTQPRLIPDAGNSSLGITQQQGSQVPLNTTRLDQLDIVRGMKLLVELTDTWTTGSGKTLTASPLYPSNLISNINVKLQAAYSTINLPGWLAAAYQAFRPSWGDRGLGAGSPDNFAIFGQTPNLTGTANVQNFVVDLPFALKLDEYFDLAADGTPQVKYGESVVGVQYMAAQAKVVIPTINFAALLAVNDEYNSPVSMATGDTTSTATGSVSKAVLYRDAWFTGQNPASNPPEFAWMYTRDYFRQPTNGQSQCNAIIQNTGVSVGQVLSLVAMTWDPAGASGKGAPVPLANIDHWELVTGGTLQNIKIDPLIVQDKMRSMYGETVAVNLIDAGIFVFDFCMSEDGSYLSNANAINTYVINGVQLSCYYKTSIPSSTAVMYVGVEALKMATS